MKTFTLEEVKTLIGDVLRSTETDLIHHIKTQQDPLGAVSAIRVLNQVEGLINHKLSEES